ncbi:MAG TPA: ATP-dependent helicase, partial [bacterium]|nr:ATP-dependent helicase [bacterium]
MSPPHAGQLPLELTAVASGPPAVGADQILDGLNDAQRRAVTHETDPLLIVAGAGTGKTQVITRRIAWLIATKRARPSEILALTFTDKAAAEMEERVDVLVPYGYTDAWISTFHAFGDRVLRDHALDLGLRPDFRVLSKAEQVIFVREHLFEFPLDTYRPLGDPTRYIEAMLALISRAKDEDASPAEYRAYADRVIAEAQAHPEDKELAEFARRQQEVALTYARYQELLAKEGLADFGDLITLTLRLLRDHPIVLRDYRERFTHILVDEFQDTNYAQFQLVRLLVGDDGPQRITVVGDDDQSIYKFRGAAISNILNFLEVYPHATRVVLTDNYRSSPAILDTSYRLIQHNNPDRLEAKTGLDKRLRAV